MPSSLSTLTPLCGLSSATLHAPALLQGPSQFKLTTKLSNPDRPQQSRIMSWLTMFEPDPHYYFCIHVRLSIPYVGHMYHINKFLKDIIALQCTPRSCPKSWNYLSAVEAPDVANNYTQSWNQIHITTSAFMYVCSYHTLVISHYQLLERHYRLANALSAFV